MLAVQLCFDQRISFAFSFIMWSFAFMWKGPMMSRLCVAYFALMETIQAAQYSVIDDCDNMINKVLTLAGMVHLVFQPVFVNMYIGGFMNKAQRRYLPLILGLSVMAGVMMVNRFWLTKGDIHCTLAVEPMCGRKICTFRGDVHLAWQLPLQHADQDYFTPGFQLHFFMFFLPHLMLGMWQFFGFLMLSGPILGRLLTAHQDEIPAIWCFFSIVQVFAPMAYAYFAHPDGARAYFANKVGNSNSRSPRTEVQKVAVEEEDAVGGWPGIFRKALFLVALLTAKRFAVMAIADAKAYANIGQPFMV